MTKSIGSSLITAAFCIAFSWSALPLYGGTIIKLGLGGDPLPDIEFSGGIFSTVNDGIVPTTGEQNTNVEFQDFLSGLPDIGMPPGSFTLNGLVAAVPVAVFPAPPMPPQLVIQNFTGGTFEIYNAANILLLSAQLFNSSLTGPVGQPATGALFTTSFAKVTGGTLQSLIKHGTLTLSMSLTNVLTDGGGPGFSIGGTAPFLRPFKADTTLNIAADPVPEPACLALFVVGAAFVASSIVKRRNR